MTLMYYSVGPSVSSVCREVADSVLTLRSAKSSSYGRVSCKECTLIGNAVYMKRGLTLYKKEIFIVAISN